MNALMHVNASNEITMSSLEIAELTGKRHDHILVDVRNMLDELKKDDPSFRATYKDSMNRDKPCYNLPKRETLILVSGYSIELRARIIDRWQELENATPKLPTNLAEALRLAADLEEQKQLALIERDHAIRTKAEIGSRREATAMNTAAVATKKANALEIELDKSKSYATIKRMEMLYHGQKFNWRLLKSACQDLNIESIDVFDANYGTCKAYPEAAWLEAYAITINNI